MLKVTMEGTMLKITVYETTLIITVEVITVNISVGVNRFFGNTMVVTWWKNMAWSLKVPNMVLDQLLCSHKTGYFYEFLLVLILSFEFFTVK